MQNWWGKKIALTFGLAMTSKKYIPYTIMALSFIGVIFVFSSSTAKAADDHIVINEICSKPESGNAWIEIYNPGSLDIDLKGYTIEDGTHKPKSLDDYSILAGGYLVIDKSTPDGFSFVLNTASAELIILRENGEIIDQVAYGKWEDKIYDSNPDDDPSIPGQGKSLSRIPNGADTGIDNIDFRIMSPSPAAENILPIYSNKIIINEIVPHPTTNSADEFIEIYNSGPEEIDLSGWQIDDIISGGSSAFMIPDGTKILTDTYLIFTNLTTKISLNDSSDEANLVDPNGEVRSKIVYTTSKRGQSYSLFGSDWKWTTTLTPGAVNILTEEVVLAEENNQITTTDIAGAKNLADEEIVQVTGTVTVVPNTFSASYFYIQDSNAGIQIYNYNKLFPSLSVGDIVQITGELDTYYNERRIKTSAISDVQIIGNHSPPTPEKVAIADLSESYEGKYIQVVGIVTKTSGSVFYIHGSGEYQVSIKSGTGINKPRMKVGDKVLISGIFSQSGDTYRILPTKQNDVKILSSGKLANSGSSLNITIIISLIIFALWILSAKRKVILKN